MTETIEASWLLQPAELSMTVEVIKGAQSPTGLIAWFEGGHGDPWNHVEAAMALSAHGEIEAAERAYQWLAARQRDDGAWHAYYRFDGEVNDARLDTNLSAYVAVGVWQHYLLTGDRDFLQRLWPVVEKAMRFVLSHQRPMGDICWSVDSLGACGDFSLLTGCSSIYLSLNAAVGLAEVLGLERVDLEVGAQRLLRAINFAEPSFADKSEFAMDWYYPVLVGAVPGEAGQKRLDESMARFVTAQGVRCRSDSNWITTAESAECAIALSRVGRVAQAKELLASTRDKRKSDGSYVTGIVYPQGDEFPARERTTYSAAAVLLAHRLLCATTSPDSPRVSSLTRTRKLSQPASSSSAKRFEPSASV